MWFCWLLSERPWGVHQFLPLLRSHSHQHTIPTLNTHTPTHYIYVHTLHICVYTHSTLLHLARMQPGWCDDRALIIFLPPPLLEWVYHQAAPSKQHTGLELPTWEKNRWESCKANSVQHTRAASQAPVTTVIREGVKATHASSQGKLSLGVCWAFLSQGDPGPWAGCTNSSSLG